MLLSILCAIAAVVAVICFLESKDIKDKKRKVKYIVIGVLLFVFVFGRIVSCMGGDSNGSSWDKLSKEEKEWYHNNYGNGQYDKYKDAINNYNG